MSKKTFDAILIDAHNREVKAIKITKDLKSYYDAMKCSTFTTGFHLPKRDICFVDDEGLINGTDVAFVYEGAHQPFMNNGLIVGGTAGGDLADVKVNINEIISKVKFFTRDEVAALYH